MDQQPVQELAGAAKTSALRLDVNGDPLPPGAVARMGSARLYQRHGVQSLTFAESDMRACADEREATRELAAKKRRPWRRPAVESISTYNSGISEPNNYENTPVV